MTDEPKTFTLRITVDDREIFNAIKKGTKKVETRAATERYKNVKAGDEMVVTCGEDRVKKTIIAVQHFKSVDDMLKEYTVAEIAPKLKTAEELKALYDSFTGYKEKIAEFGIIAMDLE